MKPLISVIVPIYNTEKYLSECIQSILNQTFKRFEIVCVDDGSTDNSLNIIKSFAKKHKNIKIITRPNSGYGATINVGIENAVGKYIAIVESDDFIFENMLKTLYKTAKKHNADVVKSDYFEVKTNNNKNKFKYMNTVFDPKFYNIKLKAETTPEIFNFVMHTWTGLYKKSFLQKHNIKHNETPGAAFQDNGFWFQTVTLADKIVFVDQAFYCYRKDNPNSSINNKQKIYCMCEEYDYIKNIVDNNPYLKEHFLDYYYIKKLHNYLYNYIRVGTEFKLTFLKRFAKEFKEHIDNGEFDLNVLDEKNKNFLNIILKSPKQFMDKEQRGELVI